MQSGVVKGVFRTSLLALLAGLALPARSERNTPPDTRASVEISAGVFGIFGNSQEPLRIGLEYLGQPFSRWSVRPGIGVTLAEGGASFIYGDLRKDWWLGPNWFVSAYFGPGLFHDGAGLHLGNEVEFRSGLAVTRVIGDRMRVGIAGYHLSNGGLSDHNPGTEVAVLVFTFPVGTPAATAGG